MADGQITESREISPKISETLDKVATEVQDEASGFFAKTKQTITDAFSFFSSPSLTEEQSKAIADRLAGSIGSFTNITETLTKNQEDLEKLAQTNSEAAQLLELLNGDFSKLIDIQDKLLAEQEVTGEELTESFDELEAIRNTLLNIRAGEKINELKQIGIFDQVVKGIGEFNKEQEESNKLLEEQLFEDKTLREFLEEEGLFGQGGVGEGILELFGLGGLAIAFRNLKKGLSSLIGVFALLKPAKFAEKFPRITKFFSSIVKAFAPLTKLKVGGLGKALSKLGSFFGPLISFGGKAGKLARGIPVIGGVITAFLAIFDFAKGFSNADKIAGKAEEALTLGDKIQAGISKVLSGLTFGFVSAEKIFETIENGVNFLVGPDGIFREFVDSFKELIDTVRPIVSKAFDKISSFFDEFGSQIFDAIIAPVKMNLSIFAGIGTSILNALKSMISIVFSEQTIGEKIKGALATVGATFLSIGASIANAVSGAIKSLSFGTIDLGEIELPSFDELIEDAKAVLNVLLEPFTKLKEKFKETKDKISEGFSAVTDFLFGSDDDEETEGTVGEDGQLVPNRPQNIIDLKEKRQSLGNRGVNEIENEARRQREVQEKNIRQANQANVINLQQGGGSNAPASAGPPRKAELNPNSELKMQMLSQGVMDNG